MKKRAPRTLKAAALAGVAVSCMFWHSAAAATPTASASNDAQAALTLPDLIVTARKREEDVQKVPISVAVVTSQAVQQHQVTDYYSLQKLTPSLTVTALQGFQDNFAIRGVGTAVFGVQVEQSVGVVVDDVPISLPTLYALEPYDLQRIEVLDGPQGMLFGKNASAGLINIVTDDPQLNRLDLTAHGEYRSMDTPGTGSREKIDAAVNLPLWDTASFRFTGYYLHDDALLQNVNPALAREFLGNDQEGFRAKFLWEPTDHLRLLFTADYTHQVGPGAGLQSFSFVAPGSLTAALNHAAGVTAGPGNLQFASGTPDANSEDISGLTLKGSYDLGGGYTLTNVTAYRYQTDSGLGNKDFLPESIGLANLDTSPLDNPPSHEDQISEELRITSPSDQRLTYQAGFFYQEFHSFAGGGISKSDLGALVPGALFNGGLVAAGAVSCNPAVTSYTSPLGTCTINIPGVTTLSSSGGITALSSRSWAFFGEGQYKLTDALRITFGGRYTNDHKTYQYSVIDEPGSLINFYPTQFHNAATGADNFSWRTSINYDFMPGVMGYFSYATGYKGPGFDTGEYAGAAAAMPGVFLVKPETSENYELGVKSTLFNHRLQLNAAVFDETFTNFQTQADACLSNGTGGCSTTILTTNAGKLFTRGAEATFTALPLEGLTINGGLTYLDAYYSGLTASCYPGQPVGTASGQCSSPVWSVGSSNDNGIQLTQAPKWSGDLSGRYEHAVWTGWNGFAQADLSYKSSYAFSDNNDPRTRIPAFTILDLSLGAKSDDGHLGVTFFVKNVTDQRVPTFVSLSGVGVLLGDTVLPPFRATYVQEYSPDSFRQIGISLDYKM